MKHFQKAFYPKLKEMFTVAERIHPRNAYVFTVCEDSPANLN